VNRLASQRSPYLLQHADNPVDWFPWGDDAFARARQENKPIFLSIGYSTCHWCHVMAHESFESEAVAGLLNDRFVSIKVDREERPDVDRVYMTFVQATTGSGGWPMSVWLTPDLEPFYGGTYFPPTSRWGRPGFVDILSEIARVWAAEPDKVRESARALTDRLRGLEHAPASADLPGEEALARTMAQFREVFDSRHGGFGDAPKFPRPSELLFLLREHARTGDQTARVMALRTLRAIAEGGMRDHIGGGFHRYSVDREWRVPHFEKMLYDQAQLVLAFLEAAQASGESFFADVAADTLEYVLRDMTDTLGGFYSAEDADSVPPEQAGSPAAHKAEGAFYLWRAADVDELLGDEAAIVTRRFGIRPDGNAPADPQQEFTGKNILYAAEPAWRIAEEDRLPTDLVVSMLDAARMRLFQARVARPRPHLDDKVLTCWNGLMIAAFARAARVLGAFEAHVGRAGACLDAARRAADFVRQRMWNAPAGTLLRCYRAGEAGIEGYAEDYAFLIFGLLELFQADPDPRWLDWAQALQRRQDELFWDDRAGGWFSTTGRDASVLMRMKDDHDGAEPTASAIGALNLLTLSHLVEGRSWTSRIDETFRFFAGRLEHAGRAVPMVAAALSTSLAGLKQIVVSRDGEEPSALERIIAGRYLPFAVTFGLTPERRQALAPVLPFVASMRAVNGLPAAYVCRNFSCLAPVTALADLENVLL
jgi:hypothetical protein